MPQGIFDFYEAQATSRPALAFQERTTKWKSKKLPPLRKPRPLRKLVPTEGVEASEDSTCYFA